MYLPELFVADRMWYNDTFEESEVGLNPDFSFYQMGYFT